MARRRLWLSASANHRVTASLGCGGTHPAAALWTHRGVSNGKGRLTDPADPFTCPQPQAPALPGSAGAGSPLISSTPRIEPALLQCMGSRVDITAENLHLLIWQGQASVPKPVLEPPCPISAGSWVTAETYFILGVPMCWVNLPELAGPCRDPACCLNLIYSPPGEGIVGVCSSSSWRCRCSRHKAHLLVSSL